MFKIFKTLVSVFILLILVVYYFKIPISSLSQGLVKNISPQLSKFEKSTLVPALQKFKKEVFSPPPLRVVPEARKVGEEAKSYVLSRAGIIAETNRQRRVVAGLAALTENSILNKGAEQKLQDLFAKQYFEHISPSGIGPAELAKSVGYEYIVIGENLALGNFEGNQALVDAWMASPGHRANILNTRYREIGVAVGEGTYEGRKVWIGVQEFGLSFSSCPSPHEETLSLIKKSETVIANLQIEIDQRRNEIDRMSSNNPSYNEKVRSYNDLVVQYNSLISATKGVIAEYNKEVEVSNLCRSGN